ncbi:AraC family transcriptional regulator [Chitinophaga solisilvae]|uniref:Helix-turn-helix domain-containing protein n=1 Tax=Chitinophaga solisilvae TaxID=1233460 RepID=A0A9Q5DBT2_9BACT|nr:helix-turn-helix domain-containing protein [Chitinophaga solisilvae]NSL87615.1 helix-turn-helix domain-containing protein [Chitinophaga solisilvae]
MKSSEIAVLSADMFKAGNDFFWMGTLACILEKYPQLEWAHRQSFYTLLCIENAQGAAVIDGIAIRLDRPKVICVKPGSIFSMDINRAATGTIIFFKEDFFSLRYNNNALFQFSFINRENSHYVRLDETKAYEWKQLCSFMQQEFNRHHKGAGSILRSFLNILLCKLDRQFEPSAIAKKNNTEEKLRRFQLLLDEHFIKHKTPSFYAEQLNITTNYMNKICRKYKSLSSGELIRKRITIEAQRLLHYSGGSVAEIAKELEFESVSYFVTFFKKNTGMTPERFRKNQQ